MKARITVSLVVCALVAGGIFVLRATKQESVYRPIPYDQSKWVRSQIEWNRLRTDVGNPRLAMAEDIIVKFPHKYNKALLMKEFGTPTQAFSLDDGLHRNSFEPFYESWLLEKTKTIAHPKKGSKLAYQILFNEYTLQSSDEIYIVFLLDQNDNVIDAGFSNGI